MSTLEATVSMLETLSESDLLAVKGVVQALAFKGSEEEFFKQMTKEEFMDALAEGRKDVEGGRVMSAQESVRELREMYGL